MSLEHNALAYQFVHGSYCIDLCRDPIASTLVEILLTNRCLMMGTQSHTKLEILARTPKAQISERLALSDTGALER